jgi:dTMP kinase
MKRGAFLTLEGVEGVGKSTSLNTITTHLAALGKDVWATREPGGTALGEAVRHWILDGDHGSLPADVEALLMFAARKQHLEEVILPKLAAGQWVVCDRFHDATMAYQGGGRGADPKFLQALAEHIQGGLWPDLTLLLDAPVEVGLGRIANRDHDHFERENRDFFERVRQTYLQAAICEPGRIKRVDASRNIDAVAASIRDQLDLFVAEFDPDTPAAEA